jgi:acyl-CoA synthetase (NDP forming)
MGDFADLRHFFAPRSVAIVGASANPDRIGGRPLRFFVKHGYGGALYPVNPARSEIAGLRCYPSISDVPGTVDLAVLSVDASHVEQELTACAAHGVRSVIIFSGGFSETGPQGEEAQQSLKQIAERTGIRVSGPNTIGSAHLHEGVCPSFAICLDRDIEPGPIGFVSQSGAFGSAIVGQSLDRHMGIGAFACTGNEVDLEFSDYAHFLLSDDRIRSVAGYIEGLRDGTKFLRLADDALQRGKPLVMLKVGRSASGARTAASHTASMTGSDRVYDAVFRQKGVLRVRNTDELLDSALLCAMVPEPLGKRLAILSISGGANVLMADECESAGIELPRLSESTREILRQRLPSYAVSDNPVDLTGQFINSPDTLPAILEALMTDPAVDAVLLFMSVMYPQEEAIVGALREARTKGNKPLVAVWTAGPPGVLERLRRHDVCALEEPTRAIRALAGYCRFASLRRQGTQEQVP